MGYPPPSRTGADSPVLTRSDHLPPGSFMDPVRTDAEVLYADRQWRPAKVLGWHRLDVAHQQPITQRRIFWLVRLQLETGQKAWFEYDTRNLRPREAL